MEIAPSQVLVHALRDTIPSLSPILQRLDVAPKGRGAKVSVMLWRVSESGRRTDTGCEGRKAVSSLPLATALHAGFKVQVQHP